MQIANLVAHRLIYPTNGTTVAVMPTSTAFQSPGGQGGAGLLVINTGSADVRLSPATGAAATIGPHSSSAVQIPAQKSVFFGTGEPIANAPWLVAYSLLGNVTIKVCVTNTFAVWLSPAPDLGADVTAFPFDSSLPPPFVGTGGGSFSGFSASGTTTLAVSTASAFTPVAGTGNILKITNSGTVTVNFMVDPLGPTPPPVVGQSQSVGAGETLYFNGGTVSPNVLTAITQSGAATLTIARGNATVT